MPHRRLLALFLLLCLQRMIGVLWCLQRLRPLQRLAFWRGHCLGGRQLGTPMGRVVW